MTWKYNSGKVQKHNDSERFDLYLHCSPVSVLYNAKMVSLSPLRPSYASASTCDMKQLPSKLVSGF